MDQPAPRTSDSTPPELTQGQKTQGLVLRNTLWLVAAQVLGMPLSVAVNATMARYLGPQDFGDLYLAGTFASLGFLFVDWGQLSVLPAAVARDRSRAKDFLGTGLAWRLAAAAVTYVLLTLASKALGYGVRFQGALALVALSSTIAAVTSSFQDTIRGFERADVAAYGFVGQQLLSALFVVPTLMLGGRLHGALAAQAAAYAVVCLCVGLALRSMRIGTLSVRRDTLRKILSEGSPFLVMGLIVTLQPNIDALFLSRLSPPETLGWLAAARKLVGVLVFPAASLVGASYPTLCRLYVEDREGYFKSASSTLRTSTILVVPVALGCALYADIGIRIFSRATFGPAEADLRVLSLFVFLLYFTMMLGVCLTAAGLQRPWAITQMCCVLLSAIADPLLIPWFQRRMNNGGVGVCVTTVLTEGVTVAAAFALAPRGLIDRALLRGIGLAAVAGGAMALVARLLSSVNAFVAAPIAVGAYVACLWLVGGLDKEQIAAIRGIVSRKARRAAG